MLYSRFGDIESDDLYYLLCLLTLIRNIIFELYGVNGTDIVIHVINSFSVHISAHNMFMISYIIAAYIVMYV